MDVLEQLTVVWSRRFALLAAAVLVALAVFAWRVESPERYEATSTVRVLPPDPATSDPTTQVDYYADVVSGYLVNRDLVAEALRTVGRDDDPQAVVEQVTVASGGHPGFVTVTAPGPDRRAAARLADVLVRAVDQRAAAEQTTEQDAEQTRLRGLLATVIKDLEKAPAWDAAGRSALIRERAELVSALRSNATAPRWRIEVVEAAEGSGTPVAPRPLRDGVMALLVALILLAEGLVLWRAGRGTLPARGTERAVSEVLDLPAVVVGRSSGPARLAPLLPALDDARVVAVAHVGRARAARTAALLADLLAARGDDVVLADGSPARPSVAAELGLPRGLGLTDLPEDRARARARLARLPRRRRVAVMTAGDRDAPGASDVAGQLALLADAAPHDRVVVALSARRPDDVLDELGFGARVAGAVVLDVERGSSRRALAATADTLRGLGFHLVGATVSTPASLVDRFVRRARRGLGGVRVRERVALSQPRAVQRRARAEEATR